MRPALKMLRAALAWAAVFALGIMLGVLCAAFFGVMHAAVAFIDNTRDGWRAAQETWRDLA